MAGSRRATHSHTVKPRWVWGGLGLAIAGIALIGVGLTVEPRRWIFVGVLVFIVGAAVALRGGILFDVHRTSPVKAEVQQVLHGTHRPGTAPGQMVHDPNAQRDARAATQVTRKLEAGSRATPTPSWSPVTGWMLLLVTVVLAASQWELVAHDATGRSNSFRDTGLAILIGLAGLRFVVSSERHWVAGPIAIASGAALILGGWLAEHHSMGLAGVEIVCGALTIAAAVGALTGRPSVRSIAADTPGARSRANRAERP